MLMSVILVAALTQAPEKLTIGGAKNVTRVDAAVMCAGATAPEAFPEIKKQGFVSIINLRRETEPGAEIEAARRAADAVGMTYIHIPVDPARPSRESVDAFLNAVTSTANQPIYIHCGSANRVAALWLIKRVVVDGWDIPRATAEAKAIGLTSPALEKFAVDYASAKKR